MGVIIYLVLAYWAVGQTIFKDKIRIGSWQALFLERVTLGAVLGFILIPVAIIRILIGK